MKRKHTFEENVMAYHATWYRTAYGIVRHAADAEDVVCESILKAYEKRDTLQKASSFKSWMTGIVLHTAYDYIRTGQRMQPMPNEELPEQESYDEPVDQLVKQDEKQQIWSLVQDLEEPFRMVIILYYYEEFSTKEIAKLLGISRGTVKSRLARGRRKLFRQLSAAS